MKYPILGRERRRPIALSAVGTVLVLAFACVLFTLTVLAIQPGLLSDTLAAFWEDKRNISAIHKTSAAAVIILNAVLFALIIARLPKT